ncbi:hypothetical protein CJ739_521 [Mariniflexile rhizosphaerae]|uniref:hypothetical protein n=1 Tax=unclassified Mariniflexile TaxID=2643887 RepID=UPI000CBF5BC1|nr:hypothetical protein [Mariniflexile sp. TRM1-10]AXP79619.1 hypothetical protein CJ739_521 [Mariniflexile sp. TRM1-10]PLB18544.1 MAG: hypothetical protein TRG1_2529 [Flavobacteriaceae bacterium FS1-H7996/R]
MDTIATNIELLYEKAKDYAEINIELGKLYAIDKIADVASSILSRLVITMGVAMVVLFLSIGLSLYLGELLGKDYFGFLVVSGFYLIVTICISFYRDKIIKAPVANLFIEKLLKKKHMLNNSKTNSNDMA